MNTRRAIVDFKLAVCVQIDGPVRSVYLWEGKMCEEMEWRLLVKFLATRQADLERYLDEKHPYETHEWMVMKPGHVAPKYLAWAQDGESDSK